MSGVGQATIHPSHPHCLLFIFFREDL